MGKLDLNSSDIRGKTPLIYASAFGKKVCVEFLLRTPEVDVNALDDTQKSALHHAAKRMRSSAEELEENRANASDIVSMLLNAGAYIEARDHNGCTALMFAVANGDESVAATLVMSRANVNVKDFEGHMPLDYAMNFGHENLAQLLKDAGAYGIFEEDQDVLQSPPSVGSATSPFTLPASPEPGSAPQEDAQFVVNDAPVEEVPEKKKKKK